MKNHPLWSEFSAWADSEGVNLEQEVDWKPWWDCFLAGSIVGVKAAALSLTRPLSAELENIRKQIKKVTKS